MQALTVQSLSFQPVSFNPTSETELEHAVGLSLLEDYNRQLAGIAQTMRETLNDKQRAQDEISKLQTVQTREVEFKISGRSFAVSPEEALTFKNQYPELNVFQDGEKNYITQESLEARLAKSQERLAGLNANSEMTSLQIQSLVDQRKNAITLLSNLIASRNESLMGIIRNLKN